MLLGVENTSSCSTVAYTCIQADMNADAGQGDNNREAHSTPCVATGMSSGRRVFPLSRNSVPPIVMSSSSKEQRSGYVTSHESHRFSHMHTPSPPSFSRVRGLRIAAPNTGLFRPSLYRIRHQAEEPDDDLSRRIASLASRLASAKFVSLADSRAWVKSFIASAGLFCSYAESVVVPRPRTLGTRG